MANDADADPVGADEVDPDADPDPEGGAIAACETSPGRVVFTDEDNSDAWIATDHTVEVRR